ncbi:MAG: hypothetical protein KDC38_17900, partial [Planctomycetes bacterium]|nr:hypothetical protein [Planctomycetota bacterium]
GRGRLRLKSQGTMTWRYRDSRDPRSFGLGKDHGLVAAGEEVLEYSYDLNQAVPECELLIAQDLPSDLVYTVDPDPTTGDWPPFNPNRDLRTEVWPKITILVQSGTLPPTGGFIEIYGQAVREVIYYERAIGNELRNCLRGQLGSPIGAYVFNVVALGANGQLTTRQAEIKARLLPQREVDLLTRGMLNSQPPTVTSFTGLETLPLTQLGVTRLVGNITDETFTVESNEDFPSGLGYFMTDEGLGSNVHEIVAYQYRQSGGSGALFARARNQADGAGLFRGRYGTNSELALNAGLTVVEFPVRYHDRYQPEVESEDLSYYQRQITIPGARWDSIQWVEQEPRNRALNTQVRVVARFDGAPEWSEKPTNQPGGLYLFTDGEATNRIEVEAETMELRVYFFYPQGSYSRNAGSIGGGWNDSWKHSPTLDSIDVHYRKPWRVTHREDLSY